MTVPPSDTVQVIDSAVNHKLLSLIKGRGTASVVLWPGNGSRFRTVQVLDMAADDTTVDLSHSNDCVYYVSNGGGRISDLTDGSAQPLVEGSIVHIDGGDSYRLEAGPEGMRVVGGPVPADPALYEEFAVKVAE